MNSSKIIASLVTLVFFFTLLYFLFPGAVDLKLPSINWPKLNTAQVESSATKKSRKANSNTRKNIDHTPKIIDSYKGVDVYYNGKTSNVYGRNTTKDGYNIGLKYQCVEFVKRFYYEHYNHKMPNSYGHAKEFFDYSIPDGGFNTSRGLKQFKNNSAYQPSKGAIIVFGSASFNQYGHVAIISDVGSDFVEIIQQNPGPNNRSRGEYKLTNQGGKWKIHDNHIVGWLSF